MLLVDLLSAADRETFLACGFDDLVEKSTNDFVTIGAYPYPFPGAHKSADHSGAGGGPLWIPSGRSPLDVDNEGKTTGYPDAARLGDRGPK
jgi:hypothetical protein